MILVDPGTTLVCGGDEIHAGPPCAGPRMFAFGVGIVDNHSGDECGDNNTAAATRTHTVTNVPIASTDINQRSRRCRRRSRKRREHKRQHQNSDANCYNDVSMTTMPTNATIKKEKKEKRRITMTANCSTILSCYMLTFAVSCSAS